MFRLKNTADRRPNTTAGRCDCFSCDAPNFAPARSLYESRGFRLIREYPESRFGGEIVSLDFALALR